MSNPGLSDPPVTNSNWSVEILGNGPFLLRELDGLPSLTITYGRFVLPSDPSPLILSFIETEIVVVSLVYRNNNNNKHNSLILTQVLGFFNE